MFSRNNNQMEPRDYWRKLKAFLQVNPVVVCVNHPRMYEAVNAPQNFFLGCFSDFDT